MFGKALTEIVRRLDELKRNGLLHNYALIGGMAVSAWGVPRATRDIDFVVRVIPRNYRQHSMNHGWRAMVEPILGGESDHWKRIQAVKADRMLE